MNENYHHEKGLHFEALMRRAYKTNEKNSKKGIHSGIYEALVNYENDKSLYKKSSHFIELDRVRNFLINAMYEFLKRNLTADERIKIEDVKHDLLDAQSTTSLDFLIDYSLDVTQPYKEW